MGREGGGGHSNDMGYQACPWTHKKAPKTCISQTEIKLHPSTSIAVEFETPQKIF